MSLHYYENPSIPHVKCYLSSAIIGDERLLRREILCLLQIFRAHLRSKGFEKHGIAPILMISLMRPQHARIIEGYFDGKKLVISKSPLYGFTREENAPLRLFARSTFSTPIEDTAEPATATAWHSRLSTRVRNIVRD
ncbi:hypothetical protein BDV29DRAFT_159767 [Aspergillus leporis]|uniref:Uncharacterized protein n=1 Tax=Aspergillus leporis TaxID=41062 RepID=A0A5N5WRJ7_9EURO|nr:hypothetical protein BDV29DRAFT_159767 [Aspergillus leporis]